MTRKHTLSALVALSLIGALAGCQSLAATGPATVSVDDGQGVSALKTVLAKALNRASVEIGPMEANSASVSVLPPPLGPHETHSVALPVVFDIVLKGETCFAVRRDTGVAYELSGVKCVAVKP